MKNSVASLPFLLFHSNRIESYFFRSAVATQPISILVISTLCRPHKYNSMVVQTWRLHLPGVGVHLMAIRYRRT